MSKVAIVAALEREVSGLIRNWSRVDRDYEGRKFVFFERDELVLVCGGIGVQAARRAAEAVVALYRPGLLQSVGFAGALDASLHVGDVFAPGIVVDARDGSRVEIEGGDGKTTLVTFMAVAGIDQKANLAQAYGAQAVDMEAAAVAAAARPHGIHFAATKVISDELSFEMPQMDRFIDSQGQFRTASFALFAAFRPWLWSRVAQLASNSRKAARALGGRLTHQLSHPSEKFAAPAAAALPPANAVTATGVSVRGHK
jgi:adenosylhomocysteine nucleosidase